MRARYTAFIPARAGSKSIPGKNTRLIAGRPLIHWVLAAAEQCDSIDRIVVSTDGEQIERVACAGGFSKLEIHHRSAESATDNATTEQVLIEYAQSNHDFEHLVLVQATSPLLSAEDLTGGIAHYESGEYDSLLSAVRQKRFIWLEKDGEATPINYHANWRPRRQDFDGLLVENGAFYVTSRQALQTSGCRLSGRIGIWEMDPDSYHELDEPQDWGIVERLLEREHTRSNTDLSAPVLGIELSPPLTPDPAVLRRIRAVFTDCDGVLTDGGMYYSENGDELKRFHTRDGHGFQMLREHRIVVGIITSEAVDLVLRRAAKLRLDEVHSGVQHKLGIVQGLCKKYGISLGEVAYIGDDVLDVPVLQNVGLACSVSDAMPCAKEVAHYVTDARGGAGAVRELAELIVASRTA